MTGEYTVEEMRFLSTPSARRATMSWNIPDSRKQFLSTPSARRATQRHFALRLCHRISIHALREEGDARSNKRTNAWKSFLSTPSARRATSFKPAFVRKF